MSCRGPFLADLCRARVAETKEVDSVSQRHKWSRCCYPLIESLIHGKLKITDGSAPVADEMVVRLDVRIKAVKRASRLDPVDETLFCEDHEISVHGAHAQPRKILLQCVVDPIRTRVSPGGPQQLEHPISLPAPPITFRHELDLLMQIGTILTILRPDGTVKHGCKVVWLRRRNRLRHDRFSGSVLRLPQFCRGTD